MKDKFDVDVDVVGIERLEKYKKKIRNSTPRKIFKWIGVAK